MGLQKQIVPLIFKGIQTGVDPKVLSTELMRLENGRLDRIGAICKRHGSATIATDTRPFVTKFQERPVTIGAADLKVFDGDAAASAGNFDSAGSIDFTDIEPTMLSAVKRSLYFYPDFAVLGSVLVVCFSEYKDVAGTHKYVQTAITYDSATGLQLDSVELEDGADTTPRFPRIGITGSTAFVWYANDSDKIAYHTVSSAGDISATAAWTSVGTSINGTETSMDVCNFGDGSENQCVCYVDTADDIQVGVFDGSSFTSTTSITTGTALTRVACFQFGTGEVIVGYFQKTPARVLFAKGFDTSLGVICSETQMHTSFGTTNATVITGAYTTLGSAAVIYCTRQQGAGYDPITDANTLTVAAASGTPGTVRMVGMRTKIASEPFGATGHRHILLHHRSREASGGTEPSAEPLQSSYFLLDETDRVVGKCLVNRGGPGMPADEVVFGGACSVYLSGSEYYTGALMTVGHGRNVWGGQGTLTGTYDDVGFAKLTMAIGVPSHLKTMEHGLLLIPNSNPWQWDGQNVVEQGFLMFPEGLVLSHSAGGGLLGTGQYGWLACYEWVDARGQIHRSSPSPVITYTPAAAETVTIKVPTLTLTDKVGVKIVLYRTISNGSIYYRHMEAANDPEQYTVTFTDISADTTLAGRARIYTTGNVLENIQPRPHRVCCIHQARLFYVDREAEKTTIWYSRYLVDGDGPGWNDVLQIQVPEEGGAITALASYHDRLLIFKEARVYGCDGNGLSDSGQGQDYSVPILLSTGYGCTDQKTIVELPDGVAFLTSGGLALLKPDFTIDSTFGLPAQYHTDTLTLSAAVLISELEYVIWTTTTGVALVYNYAMQQWSTFTDHAATDAVESGGVLYLHYGSNIRVEKRSTFLDGSTSVRMLLVTGWIPVSQMAGFGRLYSICVVGQNIAAHNLVLQPRYDLDPHWDAADKVTFNAGTLGSAFDYGSYFANAGLAASFADKGYELIAGTRRQKMRLLQFQVYDEDVDGVTPTNEGFSLSQLLLLVGVKPPWLRKATAREMS